MKSIIICCALAVLVQCGQSRHLLAPTGATVKCENISAVTCDNFAPKLGSTDVWRWDGQKDVQDNETDAVIQASCCVFNASAANSTCASVTCGLDRVPLSAPDMPSVDGKLWEEAENLCCEPAFTANDNCTDVTACPVKYTAKTIVQGQLANISKSDDAAQQAACCDALPACDDTTCPEGMTAKNASFTPDTEDERDFFCCMYPANANCADVNSPEVNGTEALNCTKGPNGAYAFVVEAPLAFSKNADAPVLIEGQDFFGALDLCCEKVQYAASATCAKNFDCAKVAPAASLINNPLKVNESLAGINIIDETEVAAICCEAASVPDTDVTTDACVDLDTAKATAFTGKATLVAGSAGESCPTTCIEEADLTIFVDGACRKAVFKPMGTDCPSAMGITAVDETGIMASIAGAFANQDAFAVTPVTDVAKQVEVTIGETCSAKYTLDDALFAKLEAPKNSATGKAASFLAAVLALLAMLVL